MVDQAKLIELIKKNSLSKHQDFILSLVKTVLEFDHTDKETPLGGSKLGGIPDLPPGFKWPKHEFDHYRFLGQINFHEIKLKHDLLPNDGILSVFVADTEELDRYDEKTHWALAFYFTAETILIPTNHPKKIIQPTKNITLYSNIDLPVKDELLKQWPLNQKEKEQFFGPLCDGLERTTLSMLGYPFCKTLAYDPTPKGEWMLLFNLDSEKKLDWSWGDGDCLLIFIEREKLINKDFSNLKVDIG